MDAAALKDNVLVARSLGGHNWTLREADPRLAVGMARELAIPELLARVLLGRGVGPDQAQAFLTPSLRESLPDPGHLKDMDIGAERLASAVVAGETIAIFGDYDVDGATSSALLARYFRALGAKTLVHIPDRMKEGYGPNTPALMELKARGASVVVTVDCGTLAFEPLEAAHEAGLDVIVVDHHMGEARRPKALAIINPNRLDEESPHRHMAAVGVSFLVAVAVNRHLRQAGFFATRPEPNLMQLLDLVALGTVCDVVSLTGVNRAFVAQGLKVLCGRSNLGLSALLDVARVDEVPGAYHLGFMLGPRVNAGGRVGCSAYGSQLLSTEDVPEARNLASALDRYNEERKAIEAFVLEQAILQAEAQDNMPLLLLAGAGWHAGVIGIVAGRLKERYGKPTAVIALDGGTGKASARSVPGFDFGAAVIAGVASGVLKYGGGHAMAAGFTVEEAQLPALHAFFMKRLELQGGVTPSRTLQLDGTVSLKGANAELAAMLERAGPFGAGNPTPRLMINHVTVANGELVKDQHVRLIVTDESGARLTVMAFRIGATPMCKSLLGLTGKKVHLAGRLSLNYWQGRAQPRFTLDDAALA